MAAYGTDDGFEAYHEARGNDLSAIDLDDVEAKRLVASEWIDGRYGSAFPGYKVGMRDQEREWPRNAAFDRYGYQVGLIDPPREIDYATYEATLIELTTPGALTVNYTPSKYKRVSIDGALSVEYQTFNSGADAQTQYARIDMILADILTGSGGAAMSSLSGAAVRV